MAGDLTASSAADVGAVELPGTRRDLRLAAAATGDTSSNVDLRRWSATLIAVDVLAAGVAVGAVVGSRIGIDRTVQEHSLWPVLSAALLVPVWPAILAMAGAYDTRYIAAGLDLYRRVINGALWAVALSAFLSFAIHANVSREAVFVSIASAAALTVGGRFAVRKALHRRLAGSAVLHRAMAIGLTPQVRELVAHVNRAPSAGFKIVGALTPGEKVSGGLPAGVRWAGSDVHAAVAEARLLDVDTIAVVAAHLMPAGQLRRLSWELESTSIELVVAPAMTDVAGPRISTRPLAGLPLLCVEKPQFSGPRRLIKETMDKLISATCLVALSPLMLAIAIAVRLTDTGPALYRQERIGVGGKRFSLVKFRTMRGGPLGCVPLDSRRELGIVPKMRRDPRLTPLGPFLRRFSLDELPQLWNVLKGDMSLVGPRPLVQSEVDHGGRDVHRRLVVKPGLTGLWQVSGRSGLSWEERIRLDLQYVDHWSVGLDLMILTKTLVCVIRGDGAF